MKKPEWLRRDLIQSPCYYTLCTTEKQFHTELKRMKLARGTWPSFNKTKHADATTHFFNTPEQKLCAIVCIKPPDPKTVEPLQICAMLVHEAVHIWQEIRQHLGETYPSSEFEAYSVQRLAQALMYEYAHQAVGLKR
jgi:hypothetical protein